MVDHGAVDKVSLGTDQFRYWQGWTDQELDLIKSIAAGQMPRLPWLIRLCIRFCIALPDEPLLGALSTNPYWARNWLLFGQAVQPVPGVVLIFERGSGGHVGFAIGQDDAHFYVLRGNQSDAVTIARIAKSRLLGARWPAIRHNDEWWMNNRNTVGKLTYLRSQEMFAPTPAIIDNNTPGSQVPPEYIQLADASPNWTQYFGFAPPEPATLPEVRIPGTTGSPPAPAPAPSPPPPEDNRHRRPPAPQVPRPGWNLLLYQLRLIAQAAQSLERQRQIYQNWIDGKGPYGETLPSPEVEVRRQMMAEWGVETPEDLDELLQTLQGEDQTTVDRPAERTDGNVEVTQDERRPDPCEIGPYSQMRLRCAARGGEAHHIVPDYTLRYGPRPTSNATDTERIRGMPTLADGNAICLTGAARVTGTEHHAAHNWTDVKIRQKGDANTALPGTTTLREVLVASYQGAALAKPGCEQEISDALVRQFGSLPQDTLLRARMQPLPTGDTLGALMRGARLVSGQVTP